MHAEARGEPDALDSVTALPGVAAAVASSRLAMDRLLASRDMRGRGDQLARESLVRAAAGAASVALARSVSVDDIRAVARDPGPDDPLVRGAARAYAALTDLAPVWRQAPSQALARLHTLAARDLVGLDDLGRPRTGEGAADRLAQLSEVIRTTRAPALVVAAVAHGEIATLKPFGSADTVVAFAAARLAMITGGLDPGSYAVLEIGPATDRTAYRTALREFGSGGTVGVAAWISYVADMVQTGVQEALGILQALSRG